MFLQSGCLQHSWFHDENAFGGFFHPLGDPVGGPFMTRPQIAWFSTRWAFYSATSPWMGEKFWFSCQVAYRSPSVCRLRKKKFRPPPLPKPMPDRVIFWAPPISHENHEKWNFQGLKSCKIIYVVGFQKLSTKVSMFFFGGVGKSVWVTKQTTRNTARKIFCQ